MNPDLKNKLEKWDANTPAAKQLTVLKDVADMLQGVIGILDEGRESTKSLGSVLLDIRESLSSLQDNKFPDYAKPVVAALDKLEKAFAKSLASIDMKPEFKPNMTIDSPDVHVAAPEIDTRQIEKLLKNEIPKAFQSSIKLIPKVNIPKPDNEPLLKAWSEISEQLVSIENALRMKPLPGSMSISNFPELVQELESSQSDYTSFQFDPNDSTPTYIGKNTLVEASDSDPNWVIYKFTYSGSDVTVIKKKTGSWSTRTSLF